MQPSRNVGNVSETSPITAASAPVALAADSSNHRLPEIDGNCKTSTDNRGQLPTNIDAKEILYQFRKKASVRRTAKALNLGRGGVELVSRVLHAVIFSQRTAV
jgi:hypothetical protein